MITNAETLSDSLQNWLPEVSKDGFETLTKLALRLIKEPEPLLIDCFFELIVAKLAEAKKDVLDADCREDQERKMRRVVELRNFLAKVSKFNTAQEREDLK